MKRLKPNTLLVVGALCLAGAGPALAASGHGHQHDHDAATATLQLDAGKKWETDAALRLAMGNIRQAMAGALPAIHENRLPTKAYSQLAHRVEEAVGQIVANCKLAPAADAQLHIVVAELLAGAEGMAGQASGAKRRNGAVQVIGALEKYATYFDDPGFKPLAH